MGGYHMATQLAESAVKNHDLERSLQATLDPLASPHSTTSAIGDVHSLADKLNEKLVTEDPEWLEYV